MMASKDAVRIHEWLERLIHLAIGSDILCIECHGLVMRIARPNPLFALSPSYKFGDLDLRKKKAADLVFGATLSARRVPWEIPRRPDAALSRSKHGPL